MFNVEEQEVIMDCLKQFVTERGYQLPVEMKDFRRQRTGASAPLPLLAPHCHCSRCRRPLPLSLLPLLPPPPWPPPPISVVAIACTSDEVGRASSLQAATFLFKTPLIQKLESRPRTLFFTSNSTDIVKYADVLWHVQDKGISQRSRASTALRP